MQKVITWRLNTWLFALLAALKIFTKNLYLKTKHLINSFARKLRNNIISINKLTPSPNISVVHLPLYSPNLLRLENCVFFGYWQAFKHLQSIRQILFKNLSLFIMYFKYRSKRLELLCGLLRRLQFRKVHITLKVHKNKENADS